MAALMPAGGLLAAAGAWAAPTNPIAGLLNQSPNAIALAFAQPIDPIDAVRRAAQRELESPASRTAVEPPSGIDPAAVAPIDPSTPEGVKAARPLADLLTELAPQDPFEARPPEDRTPPAVAAQALRLYASGRHRAAAGDGAGAMEDLEQATKLDPTAPEAWRELGDAQTIAGRRLAALSSYLQAAQRGLPDARVWWIIGRDAMRSRKPDKAVVMLARARSYLDTATDPALEYLIAIDLGETLTQSGHLHAGIESLALGLSLPMPLPWNTRQRSELIEFVRRRSDIRRNAGDACVRLGETKAALDFYSSAGEDENLDPAGLLLRRVHALRSSGRPAASAALVIDEMAAQPAPVSNGQITLVRELARDTGAAALLAPAIESLAARTTVAGETAQRQWARAIAAAMPPEPARETLRRALAAAPESDDLLGDLLATYASNDSQARVREMISVVDRSPRALALIDRMMATSPDAEGELAAMEQDRSEAAGIMRVLWLVRMGRVAGAVAASEELRPARLAAYAAAARIEALAHAGRYSEIDAPLDTVRSTAPADDRFLLARSLGNCQRFDAAYAALPEAVSADAAALSPAQLRTAALFAIRAGRLDEAEKHLLRSLASDAFDDKAYETLAGLYAPPSPIADENKLAQTIRQLRQADPTSRVLRWITAQEMAMRRMDEQAESALYGLASEGVISESVVMLLAATLERRIAVDAQAATRAEQSMRRLLAVHPETPALWVGLARVMAAAGKAEQAEAELSRRLRNRPWPELAQALEDFTREVLRKPDAAREMALARLAPAPRTIGATVSYAAQLGRDGKLDDAALQLRRDVPETSQLTTDQQNQIATVIAAQFKAAESAGDAPTLRRPQSAAAVASLFDAMTSRGGRLAPQMHQARIVMLAGMPPGDGASIIRACEQAARDFPSIGSSVFVLAAQELLNSDQPDRRSEALPVLARGLEVVKEPTDSLLRAYVLVAGQFGAAADIRTIDATIGSLERQKRIVKMLSAGSEEPVPTADDQVRAEFFYLVGQVCSSLGRRDLSEVALKGALAIDPQHGMANNDLGYLYVEERREQEAASLMLERAYKARPESENVIDSLGWLRYQQGRLADGRDPATGAEIEGAASLLSKAVRAEGGADNATIHDHLGDAMWRLGRKAEARDAWQRAHALLSQDLARVVSRSGRDEAIQRLRDDMNAIGRKLAAADGGTEPPVAPMHWASGGDPPGPPR